MGYGRLFLLWRDRCSLDGAGRTRVTLPQSRLVRNASEVSIGTPPPSVELGGPGWRFYLWQTRKRDRRLGRTSSMTCTLDPDPCSQNRAVKAPMSARAVTAAQLNTGHHLSKRVPLHPVWPRPVARLRGLISFGLSFVFPKSQNRDLGPKVANNLHVGKRATRRAYC